MFLRKALEEEASRITAPNRNTIRFDLQGAEVDVNHFDALAEMSDEEAQRSAVALYRGMLLEGCYETWVLPERDAREQACLRALEALATRTEQRREFAEALALLQRAQTLDPLNAPVQRASMRVLAARGNALAALMHYRDYRSQLHAEINLDTDAETTDLFQKIRKEARVIARPPPVAPVNTEMAAPQPFVATYLSPLPHPITALIGREEAVREVAELVVSSRLVTLAGGGVGKTRLSIEVARVTVPHFADGTAFVALAPLSDPALLPTFVASALGIREEAGAGAGGWRRRGNCRMGSRPRHDIRTGSGVRADGVRPFTCGSNFR